jgi:glutamine transport system ATP-binding protein
MVCCGYYLFDLDEYHFFCIKKNREEDENIMSIIEFRNVTKKFGEAVILKNVDLNIEVGEVVVLIGPSGSGKSTLIRCINALETINDGDLIVDGLSVNSNNATLYKIRQEAGMVFQQFNLFPQITVIENIMFGMKHVRKIKKKIAIEKAYDLLNKVGLMDKAEYYPSELSGGQKQRIAIARALAVEPKVMLFDEPTSALDPELREEVLNVMQQLAKEGMTMIVVTHEMSFAKKVGSRLMFIENGDILVDGNPTKIITDPPNERLADFLRHIH